MKFLMFQYKINSSVQTRRRKRRAQFVSYTLPIHLVVKIIGLSARAYSGLSVQNYLFSLCKNALGGASTQNDHMRVILAYKCESSRKEAF